VSPLRVVVTGSECTGKTTLAAFLAERYATVCVPEHAREYVAAKNAPADASDAEPIARGQIHSEDVLSQTANRLLIQDTDLISTIVYCRHYYGTCPSWIEEAARKRRADLYLLADIDVPWEPDSNQRDRADRREEMQGLFRKALEEFEAHYLEVRGGREQRAEQAAQAIDRMLAG
jgi:NadR type nicotinamide-nucleotide adenylyltransferase